MLSNQFTVIAPIQSPIKIPSRGNKYKQILVGGSSGFSWSCLWGDVWYHTEASVWRRLWGVWEVNMLQSQPVMAEGRVKNVMMTQLECQTLFPFNEAARCVFLQQVQKHVLSCQYLVCSFYFFMWITGFTKRKLTQKRNKTKERKGTKVFGCKLRINPPKQIHSVFQRQVDKLSWSNKPLLTAPVCLQTFLCFAEKSAICVVAIVLVCFCGSELAKIIEMYTETQYKVISSLLNL